MLTKSVTFQMNLYFADFFLPGQRLGKRAKIEWHLIRFRACFLKKKVENIIGKCSIQNRAILLGVLKRRRRRRRRPTNKQRNKQKTKKNEKKKRRNEKYISGLFSREKVKIRSVFRCRKSYVGIGKQVQACRL